MVNWGSQFAYLYFFYCPLIFFFSQINYYTLGPNFPEKSFRGGISLMYSNTKLDLNSIVILSFLENLDHQDYGQCRIALPLFGNLNLATFQELKLSRSKFV